MNQQLSGLKLRLIRGEGGGVFSGEMETSKQNKPSVKFAGLSMP